MHPTELIRSLLIAIGEDPNREGLRDTPERVVRSWKELYAGYTTPIEDIFSAVFEDGACDEMVILKDIDFSSTCEHHLLPFLGKAYVGYIPNGRVIGVSKLARLVDAFAKRLQIQEKLTQQIAHSIQEHLAPLGVAVVLEAHHQCMSCRGVSKQNAILITSSMLGEFRQDPIVRQEFLSLIRST
ncbi:MAG: GTP cyclohydrolase I FolE [Gammaproteobacteria bacterium]|nr:GTP cyclohydrolase I FolE [Gammaproteobacteria bacterium]